MNKQFFAGIAGAAILALLLHPGVFAQSADNQKPENPGIEGNRDRMGRSDDPNQLGEYDEIIIKRKDDKDAKVTIEIRDNQVFVDGKPVSQYQNDTLSIRKRKIRVIQGPPDGFSGGPFRGGHGGALSYGGGKAPGGIKPALLGVYSEKNETEGGGAKIKEITEGSAAEKAGLQKGDVITRVDEIKIENPENLYDAIHQYKPGDKVSLSYERDGKEQKVPIVLGAGKAGPVQPYLLNFPDMESLDLGNLEFRSLPAPPDAPFVPGAPFGGIRRDEGRPRLGIHAQDTEDGKGVKVLEVDGGSSAEKAGVKEGDIITRFDGQEIHSAGSLAEIARADKDKATVKISVIRGGVVKELEVRVPKKLRTADL